MTVLPLAVPLRRTRRPAATGARRPRPLATGSVAVAALHLVAGVVALAAAQVAPAPASVGLAVLLAYVWGLQHGFAADHIAAVDDATRLLVARGSTDAPLTGVGFGIGHGISATTAVAGVTLGLGRLPAGGELVAAAIVTAVLVTLSAWNARVLARLWSGRETGDRSILSLLGGGRLLERVARARHMVTVGVVFGLVSAADVVVLTQVLGAPAGGGLLTLLAVVAAFSVGLVVVDGADGALLARTYRWAQNSGAGDRRRHVFDLATTAATVVVSGTVASIQAAGLAVDAAGVTAAPVVGLAALADRYDVLGVLVVGLFAASWLSALALVRLRGTHRVCAPSGSLVDEDVATEEAGARPD